MNILMVNKYLYPRGGAETYMLSIAEQLAERGHKLAFFGMDHSENTTDGQVRTIPFLEFGEKSSKLGKLANVFKAGIYTLRGQAKKELEQLIKDFKPDIIHAHNVYNQISPAIFKDCSVPVVLTAHDYKAVCPNYSLFVDGEACERCLDGSFSNCIKQRCCHGSLLSSSLASFSSMRHRSQKTYERDYAHIISPSGFLKSKLVKGGLPEPSITVVHNFTTLPEKVVEPGTSILYIGRLSKEKGIDTLIEAYSKLDESVRPELRIAGEGPMKEKLTKLCEDLKIPVTWLGRISPKEVREELNSCGLTVVPSLWYENCSMAIMESLGYGRATVVSSSGGNPELVTPDVEGVVFQAGDSDSLAASLQKIVSQEGLLKEMSLKARARAEKQFSETIHMKNLLDVYESVLTKSSSKAEVK